MPAESNHQQPESAALLVYSGCWGKEYDVRAHDITDNTSIVILVKFYS